MKKSNKNDFIGVNMAEVLVESVQSMLKEETWTRATISNYTQNNLKELAAIVEQARNENLVDELQQICDEHLLHFLFFHPPYSVINCTGISK